LKHSQYIVLKQIFIKGMKFAIAAQQNPNCAIFCVQKMKEGK